MGAEYKVHTKLLTEFETLGVMGENSSGIIIPIMLCTWWTNYRIIATSNEYSPEVSLNYHYYN